MAAMWRPRPVRCALGFLRPGRFAPQGVLCGGASVFSRRSTFNADESTPRDDPARSTFVHPSQGGAAGTLPPPPPPPSGIPPGPPAPSSTQPLCGHADASWQRSGSGASASGFPPTARLSTAAEQYEKLKNVLPMIKEPDTPRPSPSELRVGTRLRVQWKDAWWLARVVHESETEIKVSFTSWSSEYDEWVPRDSSRLRIPAADDVDPPEPQVSFPPPLAAGAANSPDAAKVPGLPPQLSVAPRIKQYTPKPYNPEKEFMKRQLRLKEKIAAMQRVKLGHVDPALGDLSALRKAATLDTSAVPLMPQPTLARQGAGASMPSPTAAALAATLDESPPPPPIPPPPGATQPAMPAAHAAAVDDIPSPPPPASFEAVPTAPAAPASPSTFRVPASSGGVATPPVVANESIPPPPPPPFAPLPPAPEARSTSQAPQFGGVATAAATLGGAAMAAASRFGGAQAAAASAIENIPPPPLPPLPVPPAPAGPMSASTFSAPQSSGAATLGAATASKVGGAQAISVSAMEDIPPPPPPFAAAPPAPAAPMSASTPSISPFGAANAATSAVGDESTIATARFSGVHSAPPVAAVADIPPPPLPSFVAQAGSAMRTKPKTSPHVSSSSSTTPTVTHGGVRSAPAAAMEDILPPPPCPPPHLAEPPAFAAPAPRTPPSAFGHLGQGALEDVPSPPPLGVPTMATPSQASARASPASTLGAQAAPTPVATAAIPPPPWLPPPLPAEAPDSAAPRQAAMRSATQTVSASASESGRGMQHSLGDVSALSPQPAAAATASAATAPQAESPSASSGRGLEATTSQALSSAAAVKWEECLSDDKERYYHEVATGRVQWELPLQGWVSLLADDGSRYYWDPVADTTQWDEPSSPTRK
mmetsp:Transcript_73826/g.205296  ORF Transcript_73826/g.205296 Transcript_73826/m.205296 type:complete len:879 (+) Transcript_73826:93-2729(+)